MLLPAGKAEERERVRLHLAPAPVRPVRVSQEAFAAVAVVIPLLKHRDLTVEVMEHEHAWIGANHIRRERGQRRELGRFGELRPLKVALDRRCFFFGRRFNIAPRRDGAVRRKGDRADRAGIAADLFLHLGELEVDRPRADAAEVSRHRRNIVQAGDQADAR